ncbi:hypothetical protein [Flavipsychrobacter stenotrophus]|uniref:hypothetical protein n=1 Tax=Flavipsychrobacter stenotrophus TaxID=2077091 RepID=UPI001056E69E|nr:hypothetical protein [Flavipsychrobacter stenotrophus]
MKTLFHVVVLAFCTAFLSCKKNYTCTCTLDTRLQNHAYSQSNVIFPYSSVTRAQARKKCSSEAANYNATGGLNYMHDCGL